MILKMNLYSKTIDFDVTYHLTFLFLTYKEIWFYCYSEKKNDLNIYKFNYQTKKSIIMRSRIYTPQWGPNSPVYEQCKLVIRFNSGISLYYLFKIYLIYFMYITFSHFFINFISIIFI